MKKSFLAILFLTIACGPAAGPIASNVPSDEPISPDEATTAPVAPPETAPVTPPEATSETPPEVTSETPPVATSETPPEIPPNATTKPRATPAPRKDDAADDTEADAPSRVTDRPAAPRDREGAVTSTSDREAGSSDDNSFFPGAGPGSSFGAYEPSTVVSSMRIYIPDTVYKVRRLRAVIMWGGNGAGATAGVWDNHPALVAWARKNRVAILAYVQGAGFAGPNTYLPILEAFAKSSGHAELMNVPWLLRGFSQSGYTAYFNMHEAPERVAAFSWNTGSPIGSGNPPNGSFFIPVMEDTFFEPRRTAAEVPGLLSMPALDTTLRKDVMSWVLNQGRNMGAPWSYQSQPGVGHEYDKQDIEALELPFFEAMLARRLPQGFDATSRRVPLRKINLAEGWVGDNATRAIRRFTEADRTDPSLSWLPSERFAKDWQAFWTGELR